MNGINIKVPPEVTRKTKLFMDIYEGKIPERVPIKLSCDSAYAIEFANMSLKKEQWDVNKIIEAIDELNGYLQSDVIEGLAIRFPHVYQIMGAKTFKMGSDGFMQHPNINGLEAEDYDEFIADPYKCIVDKVLPRLYKALDTTPEKRSIAMAKGYFSFFSTMMQIGKGTVDLGMKYECAILPPMVLTEAPFDFLADFLRSFTGVMKDIRRCPEKVIQACEAILPMMIKKGIPKEVVPGTRAFIPLHMAPYLSVKQFEKFWWPSFKKLVEELDKQGVKSDIVCEQDFMRYLEYLQELPKGTGMTFEYGDPKIVKEKLGNKHIISGFYPLDTLKMKTKQECIDEAKKLIEILAPGGNFVFSPAKGILRLGDAKPENIKAVVKYIQENTNY